MSDKLSHRYDAFISYSHSANSRLSRRLSSMLRTYAAPLWRPRRIFRDEDHFVPENDLPKLIVKALDSSEFLVLLASPEAAASSWVTDELRHWCTDPDRAKRLLVVLLRGTISIDDTSKTIDWERTDALPDVLREIFVTVPLYVDLRWVEREDQMSVDELEFRIAINALVARLEGKEK